MQLRHVTGPVLALGGSLVWGILETIALQRARRLTAAHEAARAVAAGREPRGTPARDESAAH